MRLAILEDDHSIRTHVSALLGSSGHQVREFHEAKGMLKALRLDSFDLLLLDWSLPDKSGIEVLAWVKEHLDPAPPVIMITARTTEADIVTGLTAGADDYVTKPVQDEVLKARVDAVLRRVYRASARQKIEQYGHFAFDIEQHTLTSHGNPIAMTAKEFGLALLLFRNLHRPLSRDYIMDAVWGHSPDMVSRTLDAHVSQIRSRMALRPENGYRLSSVYSFGYRLEEIEGGHGALADEAA